MPDAVKMADFLIEQVERQTTGVENPAQQ